MPEDYLKLPAISQAISDLIAIKSNYFFKTEPFLK